MSPVFIIVPCPISPNDIGNHTQFVAKGLQPVTFLLTIQLGLAFSLMKPKGTHKSPH